MLDHGIQNELRLNRRFLDGGVKHQTRVALRVGKTCNCCGRVHTVATAGAVENDQGIWFNCFCGSSLLSVSPRQEAVAAAFRAG